MTTIPPAEYADLDLVGFLYNGCYGGFGFSNAFMAQLNERRTAAGLPPTTEYELLTSMRSEGRHDPLAIALFLEMGSVAASGSYASIRIIWFPREFIDSVYVKEYDGKETPSIPFLEVKATLLDNFLRERQANPALTLDDLEQRHKNLMTKQAQYEAFQRDWLWKNRA